MTRSGKAYYGDRIPSKRSYLDTKADILIFLLEFPGYWSRYRIIVKCNLNLESFNMSIEDLKSFGLVVSKFEQVGQRRRLQEFYAATVKGCEAAKMALELRRILKVPTIARLVTVR